MPPKPVTTGVRPGRQSARPGFPSAVPPTIQADRRNLWQLRPKPPKREGFRTPRLRVRSSAATFGALPKVGPGQSPGLPGRDVTRHRHSDRPDRDGCAAWMTAFAFARLQAAPPPSAIRNGRVTAPCGYGPRHSARTASARRARSRPGRQPRTRTGTLPACRTTDNGAADGRRTPLNQGRADRRRRSWQSPPDAASTARAPRARGAGTRHAPKPHASARTAGASRRPSRHVDSSWSHLALASSTQPSLPRTVPTPARPPAAASSFCRFHPSQASRCHAASRLTACANTASGSRPCMQACS